MVGIQTMNQKRLGSKMLLVFFDFETTGFQYSDEIWQMGACYGVWDKKCIHNIRDTFAENVTLVKKKLSKFCLNNCCDFDGSKITHDKVSEGIGFCNAIKKWQKQILEIKKKKKIKECMLVGHNILSFDCRQLASNCLQRNLDTQDFIASIGCIGFLDTLAVAKKFKKEWNLDSLTEENIYKKLVNAAGFENAHNALYDSIANRSICKSKQMMKVFKDTKTEINIGCDAKGKIDSLVAKAKEMMTVKGSMDDVNVYAKRKRTIQVIQSSDAIEITNLFKKRKGISRK
jgi:DNA polymerase III epsilon subunit-like protein